MVPGNLEGHHCLPFESALVLGVYVKTAVLEKKAIFLYHDFMLVCRGLSCPCCLVLWLLRLFLY